MKTPKSFKNKYLYLNKENFFVEDEYDEVLKELYTNSYEDLELIFESIPLSVLKAARYVKGLVKGPISSITNKVGGITPNRLGAFSKGLVKKPVLSDLSNSVTKGLETREFLSKIADTIKTGNKNVFKSTDDMISSLKSNPKAFKAQYPEAYNKLMSSFFIPTKSGTQTLYNIGKNKAVRGLTFGLPAAYAAVGAGKLAEKIPGDNFISNPIRGGLEVIGDVGDATVHSVPKLVRTGANLVSSFATVTEIISSIIDIISGFVLGVLNFIKTSYNIFKNEGISGIYERIKDMWKAFFKSVKGVKLEKDINVLKETLVNKSVSEKDRKRAMEKISEYETLKQSEGTNHPDINSAVRSLSTTVDNLKSFAKDAISGASSVASYSTSGIRSGMKSAASYAADNPLKAAGIATAGTGILLTGGMLIKLALKRQKIRNEGCAQYSNPLENIKCLIVSNKQTVKDLESKLKRCKYANNPTTCIDQINSAIFGFKNEIKSLEKKFIDMKNNKKDDNITTSDSSGEETLPF